MNLYGQFSLYLENKIVVETEKVAVLKMSKDGRFLAYGDQKGTLYIWDLNAKNQYVFFLSFEIEANYKTLFHSYAFLFNSRKFWYKYT